MESTVPSRSADLVDYEKVRKEFCWDSVGRCFGWSKGGIYNIAREAVDRHAEGWRRNKIAMYFVSSRGFIRKYTFSELKAMTNQFANAMTELGAARGERVFVYLDRVPELYIAALGTMKFGGVFAPLLSALGPEGVRDRMLDARARFLVTSPNLLSRLDPVIDSIGDLSRVVLVCGESDIIPHGMISFHDIIRDASTEYKLSDMKPTDPYVIHYTSGTTGKPKGVLLGHRAMVQQLVTSRLVLDLRDDDAYWCTSDPGWVTGTSYGFVGPWLLGTSLVVYEGRFDAREWYTLLGRLGVTVWYTAPTALRMLMRAGDDLIRQYDLSSLRHVCSVGEALNPEVVRWFQRTVGVIVHDTWWQTETGAMMICNYPNTEVRLGSMGRPIPGVQASIVDQEGRELPPGTHGLLAVRPGWPSMMTGIWEDAPRYREYFAVPGWYVSGDIAYMDEDGYFWFVGRADDVIKSAGERIGPFEVESVLIEHSAVAEAGVIGKPDELRGEVVKAFLTLRSGYSPSQELKSDIAAFVKERLAAYAYPREIEFVESLPKTRSGKILRRVLKAKELGKDLGDLSTLEE